MQVNKDRFPAVLPHFLELLETCDFYSFDEEMTGINVPEVAENITFSPEESYQSKRLAASRYSMIQVGVCLFHKDAAQGSAQKQQCYTARPFNFILFPNWTDELAQLQLPGVSGGGGGGGAHGPDSGVNRDVVLSPSALSFLRRHGMDFQQWVYEGISLCDGPGEKLLRQHLSDKYKDENKDGDGGTEEKDGKLPSFFTDEETAWVTESIAAAEELVKRVADAKTEQQQTLSREVMLKPQGSRSARDHLCAYAKRHLPSVVVSFRRQGSSALTTTTLTALTVAEALRKAEREAQLRQRELIDLLGFRLVFQALVDSKKPCVGHNCFADILFLMAALDQPLPATLREWKTRASTLFPKVLDTKYLVSRKDLFPPGRFPANYLGGLFEQYGFSSPRVRVTVPVGFEAYDQLALLAAHGQKKGGGGGPAHEAAFDAYMTGTLLLNLLAEVGVLGARAADGGGGVQDVGPELSNKVALFRSLYAVDLDSPSADEYVPDSSSSVVLDLQHDPTVKTAQLESLLLQAVSASHLAADGQRPQCPPLPPPQSMTLHSVDNVSRTLAVLQRGESSAAALADKIALRFPSIVRSAAPYIPPHVRASTSVSADGAAAAARTVAAFAFPAAERVLLRSGFPRK